MVKLRERCLCLGSAFARSELTQRCFRAWKLKACNARRLEQKMNVDMSCKIISISMCAWAEKTRGTLSLRALGRHGVAMVTAKLRLYCLSRTLSRWCMVCVQMWLDMNMCVCVCARASLHFFAHTHTHTRMHTQHILKVFTKCLSVHAEGNECFAFFY
jgi:hypothetical protein